MPSHGTRLFYDESKNPADSVEDLRVFFCFGFEEVKNLFKLKGGCADLQV
jgi:hypothetical protein